MSGVIGKSYFTIEKTTSLILRMLTISYGFMILSFVPIMLSYTCYPPLITSWMYRCDQLYRLKWGDYLKILTVGSLNLFIFLQCLWDALVHGGYWAFACIVCLLEYINLLKA